MKLISIILKLILLVFLINTTLFAKQQRTITLYGKVDPRLYAWVLTTYRSMHPNDLKKDYEKCDLIVCYPLIFT